LFAACVGLTLFASKPAGAESPTVLEGSQPGRWRVRVELVAGLGSDSFELLLVEWFQANSIQAKFGRTPKLNMSDVLNRPAAEGELCIWVTRLTPTEVRLYFVESAQHRFLVRDVPLRQQFDEIAREQLAQVIVTSANAFMDRRASTSEQDFTRALRADAEVRTQAQPAAVESERGRDAGTSNPHPTLLRVGAFYQLAFEHEGSIMHGPGVLLGAAQEQPGYHLFGNASAQFLVPETVRTRDVNLALHGVALRVAFGAERQWAKTGLGLQLGGGADAVFFEPLPVSGAGIAPQRGAWLWRPALAMDLRVFRKWDRVRAGLVIGVAAYLTRTQYVVVRDGATSVSYQPLLTEPHSAIELTWN
jgi:hypothetical protein